MAGPVFSSDGQARQSSTLLAVIALSLAALFWSGNFIAGRALRDDLDPVMLNTLRWLLCLVLFLPLVSTRIVRHRTLILRDWRLLLALGATGIATFQTMVYTALSQTTAANAVLMLALTPTAILIGSALSGGSRPTTVQWAGSVISLIGAAVLITRAEVSVLQTLTFNRGDLWMLGAVVAWAVYSLLLRQRPADLPQDVALAVSIVFGLALIAPLTVFSAPLDPSIFEPRVVGALLYIAVFASLVAFLLWSYGVNVLGPQRAGQFVHLMPVFGPILAVLILRETLVAPQIIGAAIVFAGMYLVNRKPKDTAP